MLSRSTTASAIGRDAIHRNTSERIQRLSARKGAAVHPGSAASRGPRTAGASRSPSSAGRGTPPATRSAAASPDRSCPRPPLKQLAPSQERASPGAGRQVPLLRRPGPTTSGYNPRRMRIIADTSAGALGLADPAHPCTDRTASSLPRSTEGCGERSRTPRWSASRRGATSAHPDSGGGFSSSTRLLPRSSTSCGSSSSATTSPSRGLSQPSRSPVATSAGSGSALERGPREHAPLRGPGARRNPRAGGAQPHDALRGCRRGGCAPGDRPPPGNQVGQRPRAGRPKSRRRAHGGPVTARRADVGGARIGLNVASAPSVKPTPFVPAVGCLREAMPRATTRASSSGRWRPSASATPSCCGADRVRCSRLTGPRRSSWTARFGSGTNPSAKSREPPGRLPSRAARSSASHPTSRYASPMSRPR